MYDIIQQIKIGQSVASTSFGAVGLLGTTYKHPTAGADGGPATFRLVKFVSAITTPSYNVVTTALSSTTGAPTWSVDLTTTANDYLVAGVIPTMAASIAASDYGWIQIDGIARVIQLDTVAVAGDPLGTATVAGRVQGVATATSLVAALGGGTVGRRLGIGLLSVTAASAASYVRIDRLL